MQDFGGVLAQFIDSDTRTLQRECPGGEAEIATSSDGLSASRSEENPTDQASTETNEIGVEARKRVRHSYIQHRDGENRDEYDNFSADVRKYYEPVSDVKLVPPPP